MPEPSGELLRESGSSWRIELIVIETGSPSGSVTPRTVTGRSLPSGGQRTAGLAVAAVQTGGRPEGASLAAKPSKPSPRVGCSAFTIGKSGDRVVPTTTALP